MKKALLMTLTIVAVIFTKNMFVNALETDSENDEQITIQINESGIGAPSEFFTNPSDTLSDKFLLRSQSKPTVFWDLSSSSYTANLQEIRKNLVYTNYYFSPNSSGQLNLDYNITGIETTGTKMRISVYNKSTDTIVSEYITAGAPTAQCMTFGGLNTSQHYAFAFSTVRQGLAYKGVTGTAVVYH
jgi:hypothetical protein